MVNGVCYTRSLDGISVPIAAPAMKSFASNDIVGAVRKPRRVYEAAFKLEVITYALTLPATNRIKPTCRSYPGVEPVQVRKWIRNLEALQQASPNAKVISHKQRALPLPHRLTVVADDSSDTESWTSSQQPDAPLSPATANYGTTPESADGSRAPDWEAMRVARELLSLGALG